MVGPLAILSAVSAASDVVSGVASLISGSNGATNATGGEQTTFSNVLQSAQSDLEITQQGAINTVAAQGAAILKAASNDGSAQISDQTLDDINNILAGNVQPTDVNTLSDNGDLADAFTDGSENTESNSGKVNILGKTKLNDPFGIQAAQANGSPIAAPMVTPADSGLNNLPTSSLVETTGQSNTNTQASNLGAGIQKQTDRLVLSAADAKELNKGKILKLAEKVDGDAIQNLQQNTVGKVGEKTTDVKAFADGQVVSNLADRLQDKNNQLSSTNAAIFGHQFDNNRMGDAARAALRGKSDLGEKLADVDTYKIVNVSKKDNVIDLRLEPLQLGKVQIKLDFTDGKTNIMVLADRQDTLSLLQRDTKSLEKILTDNGVNVDSSSLSFDLRQQSQQQQGQQGNDNSNFFSGKPLSFRVEEQINNILAANDDLNRSSGYINYGTNAATGMLNIMV